MIALRLSELTAYAREKYHIEAQNGKLHLEGGSVLKHPKTGLWVALMTQDTEPKTGRILERCDIKCGRKWLKGDSPSYLTSPFHMKTRHWLGVIFDERTSREVVCRLLDEAMKKNGIVRYDRGCGYTVILDDFHEGTEGRVHGNTVLPAWGAIGGKRPEVVPDRIRAMMKLYKSGKASFQRKSENFVLQAKFMADYEDNAPWAGEVKHYFCTYHDLNVEQLRGYFTWRTGVRRGEFVKTSMSFAYMYLYELMNGIGVCDAEEGLEKMEAFKVGYVEAGFADSRMDVNLTGWMRDYAIVHGMPAETVRKYADQQVLMRDEHIDILAHPEQHGDEDIFGAVMRFASKKLLKSPVIATQGARGKRLFSALWRELVKSGEIESGQYIVGCPRSYPWLPFANAIYVAPKSQSDVTCVLSSGRTYRCCRGAWQMEVNELIVSKDALIGVMREADRRFREYLKLGHAQKSEEGVPAGAVMCIEAVIEEDRRKQRESARESVKIDLAVLDQIRRDAIETQNSLLTDDERKEMGVEAVNDVPTDKTDEAVVGREGEADGVPEGATTGEEGVSSVVSLPLDDVQLQILKQLLRGESVMDIIKEHHLMASIIADSVNEAFFDKIGDNVLECEDDVLTIIDDYREDVIQFLGEI